MESRAILLQSLNDTVAQLQGVYQKMTDPQLLVTPLWSAKDILAHLTFWHESFAHNVEDLVNGRKPTPLKGRLIDLNQTGVEARRPDSLESVLGRFHNAHRTIQENILDPALVMIPYRRGSRDYTPEEHLSIVDAHIKQHLRDIRKLTFS